jgi:hypothetical protein
MDPLYVKFLLINLAVFTVIVVWMIGRRYYAAQLERAVEAEREELAFEVSPTRERERGAQREALEASVQRERTRSLKEVANVG